MLTIREALLAMGYYEKESGKWVKPFAFQLFTFFEEKGLLQCWYLSVKNEIELMYSKELIANESLLYNIKEFECYTKHDIHTNSQFEISNRYDL